MQDYEMGQLGKFRDIYYYSDENLDRLKHAVESLKDAEMYMTVAHSVAKLDKLRAEMLDGEDGFAKLYYLNNNEDSVGAVLHSCSEVILDLIDHIESVERDIKDIKAKSEKTQKPLDTVK